MKILKAFAIIIVSASSAYSNPISLGDFQVGTQTGQGRVPRWYTTPDGGIPDTSSWTRVDVTNNSQMSALGCSRAIPDDGATDMDQIQCAVDNSPLKSIVYLPRGTYNLFNREGLIIRRNEIVLRCESPGTTQIRVDINAGEGKLGCQGRSGFVGVCSGNKTRPETAWTGGFSRGNTQLTVSNSSLFKAGDWVRVSQDNDPVKIDAPQSQNFISSLQFAKVLSVSGSRITIDRALRQDFDYQGQRVTLWPMAEYVGIENCQFHQENISHLRTTAPIQFVDAANSWITNNHIDRSRIIGINFRHSARNLIRSNIFSNSSWQGAGNRIVHISLGSTDNVIENNIFDDADPLLFETGAQGNVASYNYFINGEYRQIFFHGMYPNENLVEGNHVNTAEAGVVVIMRNGVKKEIRTGFGAIIGDNFWGRQGERNTFFRNRITHPKVCFNRSSRSYPGTFCTTDADCGGGDVICDESNRSMQNHPDRNVEITPIFVNALIFGNSLNAMSTNRGESRSIVNALSPFNSGLTTAWIERNLVRGRAYLDASDSQTTIIDTVPNRAVAPASWSSFNGPASLYLTSAPSWWCQEACPFDLQSGIGAFGDDISLSNVPNLCKLPAQIKHEGGTCTPLSGDAVSPSSPTSLRVNTSL